MNQVKTYWVAREFWNDQPEAAAKVIAERTVEHPDDLWLIAIGPPDARPFLDNLLFNFGSMEPVSAEDG